VLASLELAHERERTQHRLPRVELFQHPVEVGAGHQAVVTDTFIVAGVQVEQRRYSRR
jgi:hypothetical protein